MHARSARLSICTPRHVRLLSASLLVVASALTIAAPDARAGVTWIDGKPVFSSDRRANTERFSSPAEPSFVEPPAARYRQYPALASGGPQPAIAPVAPMTVRLAVAEPAGSIIIDTAGRKLYYVLTADTAYAYPISVGRDGFRWTGTKEITRVQDWPSWHPPAEMRARQPGLPIKMTGGLRNPLGAKALYLGSSLYRIHGTSDESSIGRAASSGCFRMMNAHVLHLATLAGVGTKVRVVARYDGAAPQAVSDIAPRLRRH